MEKPRKENVIETCENGVLRKIVVLSPERGKITKTYAQERDRSSFENEVTILTKFHGHPNFPALFEVNEHERTFHEEYCESWCVRRCPADWREQIEEIYEIFLLRQIISVDLLNTHHCRIKNGKLVIIDFERYEDLSHLSRESFMASERLKILWESKASLISSIEEQIAEFHRDRCDRKTDM